MSIHYPFPLMPLPYTTTALEPYIDRESLAIHHDKHLGKYVDTLNKTLQPYPQFHTWSLEKLLRNFNVLPSKIQVDVKNNAGGVFNHNLYFCLMGRGSSEPVGTIAEAIKSQFGSLEVFKEKLKEAALSQFGSGYGWLAINNSGKLSVEKTLNQDTVFTKNLYPVLLVDVWEHAYYLKYQNRRDEYFESWFKVINWENVEENYKAILNLNKNVRRR